MPTEATAPSTSTARRELYSKKLGELLLKGWRMLEESCPETNEVPLMQHPSTGRKFSIATGKYTDEMETAQSEDAAAASAPPTPVAPSPAPAPAPAPAPDSDARRRAALGGPGAEAGAPSPDEKARRQQMDEWPAKMSELMLKGWKMLGENCPVTGTVPLMQHPKSARKFSVALDMYIDELPGAGNGTAAPEASAPAVVGAS